MISLLLLLRASRLRGGQATRSNPVTTRLFYDRLDCRVAGAPRNDETGSIFLVLFSAVAVLGLVGIALTSFIKGPMSSAVKLTRNNTAQIQMRIAGQAAVMAAANLGTTGDCDSDGYVEPVEWRVDGTKPNPTGGGLIPANIGAPQTDPWGNDYGYCAWDHGPVSLNASCNTTPSALRLAGAITKNQPVVAIISAGPDKTFDTTCRSFTAADVNSNGVLGDAADFALAQKNTDTSDDLIVTYTYEEATAATGGLWMLKSSDATTATINKAIEAPQAKFTGTSKLSSIGGTGGVSPSVAFASGLKLADDSVMPTCNGTNTGVIRRLASGNTVQMCDGTSWINQAGSAGLDDLSDVITNYVRNNIFIGSGVGNTTATGSGNTLFGGRMTGSALTTGTGNTGLGNVLRYLTSGSYNTAIGNRSFYNLTTGTGNTGIGEQAGEVTTAGNYNTLAGFLAGASSPSGVTAAGEQAAKVSTGSTYLTALGFYVGASNTTGTSNTGAGGSALRFNTTGIENTGVGRSALINLVSGGDNTAIGDQALTNSKANQSTAIGQQALKTHVNGDGNTAVGALSLYTANNTSSASPNTAVGYNSMTALTTGDGNVAVGYQTLLSTTANQSNTAIGREAAKSTSATTVVAIGSDTLSGAGSTAANTAIGYQALKQGAGSGIGIGYQSLFSNTGSNNNVGVGYQALYSQVNVGANTAAGYQALYSQTSGGNNTAVGYQALKASAGGSVNSVAGYLASTGNNTFGITAAGYRAMGGATATGGRESVAVGVDAMYMGGGFDVAVGYQALYSITVGAYSTAVGYQALYSGGPNNATAAGALSQYTNPSGGHTTVGYKTGYALPNGNSVAVGTMAIGTSNTSGDALGHYAMAAANTAYGGVSAGFLSMVNATNFGFGATAGSLTGKNVTSSGAGGATIGYNASGAASNSGTNAGAYSAYSNVLNGTQIGYKAAWQSPAGNNISAGSMANAANTTFLNAIALGYDAQVTAANMARMGNTNVTLIEGQVAFTVASDKRLKKDIQTSDLGLDFIMGLKPVRYRLIQGNGRLDYGFLAQDIEAKLDGRATNMITRLNDEMKTYQLRHNDLIAPIVKAIQERQARIEDLKRQVETLEKEPANCGGGAR